MVVWLSRRKELKCNEDFALGSNDGTENGSDHSISIAVAYDSTSNKNDVLSRISSSADTAISNYTIIVGSSWGFQNFPYARSPFSQTASSFIVLPNLYCMLLDQINLEKRAGAQFNIEQEKEVTLRSHLKRNTGEVGEPYRPQIELFFGRKVKYSMDSLFD